jgi:transglutaminase-like putative cysteine protease
LTSLDSFDGTEWTAGNSSAASVGLPTETTTSALRQVVTIKALRGNWLPAALGPVALSIEDNTVVFDPDSATLVAEERLGNNDRYVVWSNAAEADLTPPISDDLAVPRTVRQRLSSLANQIVRDAGAVTATDRARALEEYFLANFTYDLNVAAGSSITDITSFLQRGSGYCEQFAATFAAMARVLGIPSRVAIGYRVGTYDVSESEYRVTGRDAHAWPEVYIDGSGWVRFEPTPASGEGATDASDPATDAAADAAAPAATPEDAPTTTLPAETAPQDAADPAGDDTTNATGDTGRSLAPLLVVVLGAALALPVVLDRMRRRRSRHRARDDRRALMVWEWRDALRWLRIAGVDARPTETPLEVATRAAPVVTNASSEIAALAQLVTEACYAAADPAAADVEAAQAEVETIRRCAKAHVGRRWRLHAYVNQVKGVVVHAGSTSSSAAQPSSIS